jgi:xanthine dehydrogenase small subunit
VTLLRFNMVAMCTDFRLSLNGRTRQVSGLPAQQTLLDYVRSCGFTGAKEGCAEGECGACAVLLLCNDPVAGAGAKYRAVNSCLVPLVAMADRGVFTVEALAEGRTLTEVQTAMSAAGGSQCGYCTPGFVVSMFAEQYGYAPHERDVHSLGGNLCRCTGYRPIQDAFLSLGPAPEGPFKERLTRTVPRAAPLLYDSEEGRFSRPVALNDALWLAAEDAQAAFVAGNTDLGVVTNLRGERFLHLISLEAIPELREFIDTPDAVELGAGLSLTEIGELWGDAPAVFREWLPLFASVLIRNRATLGGNLATASPIGDAAPLLLALQAQVRIASLTCERIMPLSEFFHGYRKTALGHGEILRSVIIPKPFPEMARFFKVAKRSMDDISTVAAAIVVTGEGSLRLGMGGVAAVPVYFEAADTEALQLILRQTLTPLSDHRGSAAYRLAMSQSLPKKFQAWREATV